MLKCFALLMQSACMLMFEMPHDYYFEGFESYAVDAAIKYCVISPFTGVYLNHTAAFAGCRLKGSKDVGTSGLCLCMPGKYLYHGYMGAATTGPGKFGLAIYDEGRPNFGYYDFSDNMLALIPVGSYG
ncbi:MAG: hypothetical protein VB120_03890 [Lachnospiraceae bacterium]|nr:hypothetical protein [Lachnospiraceae bacterium]